MQNAYERQEVLSIMVELTPADIAGGGFTAKLPQGALIINVGGQKDIAFNTAGDTPTCKITVTDGTTAFINAQSLTAVGSIAAAATQKYYPTGGTLTGTITEGVATGVVTTATAGHAVVYINYIQLGKECEIYG